MPFFKILETKSSEANERKIFSKKCMTYTPDLLLSFLFTTLIISSNFSDLFLAVLLFYKTSLNFWIVFLISSYFRVIIELAVGIQSDKFSSGSKTKLFQFVLNILLTILGLHSIVTSGIILAETFENPNSSKQFPGCSTYSIFHISNENLSLIKIYCYINVGIRCIPQLFITTVFIGLYHPTGITAYLSTVNIILNMVLFSFMISISLPIRRTPKIFTNFVSLVFSAVNKFLATLCGCCANLTVFMAVFRHVEYYAFLAYFFKMIMWVFPCQVLLSTKNITKFQFMMYLFFFPLVFSFVFIHPFQETWRLYYYLTYLLGGLMDLAFLGVWAGAELTELTYYTTLKIVQIAFISGFGLLNSLQKGRYCEVSVKKIEDNVEYDELEDKQSENEMSETKTTDDEMIEASNEKIAEDEENETNERKTSKELGLD